MRPLILLLAVAAVLPALDFIDLRLGYQRQLGDGEARVGRETVAVDAADRFHADLVLGLNLPTPALPGFAVGAGLVHDRRGADEGTRETWLGRLQGGVYGRFAVVQVELLGHAGAGVASLDGADDADVAEYGATLNVLGVLPFGVLVGAGIGPLWSVSEHGSQAGDVRFDALEWVAGVFAGVRF